MEGKTVILSVFLMSLVMTQIQVEALTCPSVAAKLAYYSCIYTTYQEDACDYLTGCQTNGIPINSGDAHNEYCKVGCISSVCSVLTTLQNSDASEIMNGDINQCTKACSSLCTKGPMMKAV